MTKGMIGIVPTKGELFDYSDHAHPSMVRWKASEPITLEDSGATHFFYVADGSVRLRFGGRSYVVESGWFGSIVGELWCEGSGKMLIASRCDYHGMNQICGPIEEKGRLQYIDGCSSTLLLAAVRLGDPCFNFLHVPRHVHQTPHTHPTLRTGYIVSGRGVVHLADGESLELKPGLMFNLLPDVLHSFHTSDDELRIVIYHPDSDFGPSDEAHPMLNRTIIEGVSARFARRGEHATS